MSLKIRTRDAKSTNLAVWLQDTNNVCLLSYNPPRMFQWDAVNTSPDLGGSKCPAKPSKWLFGIKGGRQERN